MSTCGFSSRDWPLGRMRSAKGSKGSSPLLPVGGSNGLSHLWAAFHLGKAVGVFFKREVVFSRWENIDSVSSQGSASNPWREMVTSFDSYCNLQVDFQAC